MAIEDRDLQAGTRLVGRYKGQEHALEVVQTDEGLRYRLADGREFRSPSSAGKAVMEGVACNGWRFWSVDGTEPKKRERTVKAAKATKRAGGRAGAKKAKSKSRAKQSDAYGCGACGEAFPTMKAATTHALTHTA